MSDVVMENFCNATDRKSKYQLKTLLSDTLPTTYSRCTGSELTQFLRVERLTLSYLSHGAVYGGEGGI